MPLKNMTDLEEPFTHPETGEPVPDVPVVSGVYAPSLKVKLEELPFGGLAFRFRAKKEWYGDGPQARPFLPPDWEGWSKVDFRPIDALRRFVAITDEKAALGFAQDYGPLWICAQHQFPCLWRGINISDDYGVSHYWQNPEPVTPWLALAGQMRTVLEVHGRYIGDSGIRPEDCDGMGLEIFSETKEWQEKIKALAADARSKSLHLKFTRFCLRLVVNREIHRLNIGLLLDEKLKPVFHGGLGFVPSLWQQIAAILAGSAHLVVCSGCPTFFLRKRAPKRGQRNYCRTCDKKHMRQKLSREAAIPGKPAKAAKAHKG